MIAPDPIPAPVIVPPKQARAVLLTIAALHGGTVQRVRDGRLTESLGMAVMPPGALAIGAWLKLPTWIYDYRSCALLWASPLSLSRGRSGIIPTGRIDRGLNSE